MSVSGASACAASRTSDGRRESARPAQPASSIACPTAGSPSTHLVTPTSVRPRARRSAASRSVAWATASRSMVSRGSVMRLHFVWGRCRGSRPGARGVATGGGAQGGPARARVRDGVRDGCRCGAGAARRQWRRVLKVVDLAAGEGDTPTIVRTCVYHAVSPVAGGTKRAQYTSPTERSTSRGRMPSTDPLYTVRDGHLCFDGVDLVDLADRPDAVLRLQRAPLRANVEAGDGRVPPQAPRHRGLLRQQGVLEPVVPARGARRGGNVEVNAGGEL